MGFAYIAAELMVTTHQSPIDRSLARARSVKDRADPSHGKTGCVWGMKFEQTSLSFNQPAGRNGVVHSLWQLLCAKLLLANLEWDADEMGIAAEARLDAFGAQTTSIFLHDKASGGAGFSVKAQQLFADLIPEAADILDWQG